MKNAQIVFATKNAGKMREIRMILADLGLEILSMEEAGADIEVEENGASFEENAMIKAKAIAGELKRQGKRAIVLADDSGLEVDYLNKEPGIYSSRYMGEDTPYSVKNANIIERLCGVSDDKRTARFMCVIAAVFPDGKSFIRKGAMEGVIGHEQRGANGFGYDPIFYIPEYGCCSAELSREQKNAISHRGKALEAVKIVIRGEIGE